MEGADNKLQPPNTDMPIDWPCRGLEEQITEIWGHINAATYRFLTMVAEYDANEGWGWHGCRDCAHWLNWQCGIGMVAAREKVRVARALGSLPQISASFAAGELSYSKVRAMTRIATAENEAVLLNVAQHGTAAHIERLVRQYRRVEQLEAAQLADDQHRQRYLHYHYDDDGSLVIEAKLPPEVGALLLQALEAAAEVLYQEDREAELAPAPVLHNGASAESSGSPTLHNGASAETSAEKDETTAGARRADALRRLAEHFLSHAAADTASTDRFQVTVHIDQALLSQTADTAAVASAPIDQAPHRCELEAGPTLALATVRRLACDASLIGILENDAQEPVSVGRKTRSISPALKRALDSRDGGCRFPSCTRTRFTEGHHIEHWADGGETKLANLITLCRFHHRLLHEGGFGLRATDDGLLVFSRPDGSRIDDSGCFRGNIRPDNQHPLSLAALNKARGLKIDAHTARSRWTGEAMDSNMAIRGLLHIRDTSTDA